MSLKFDDSIPVPFTIESWCKAPKKLRLLIRYAAAETLQETSGIIKDYLQGDNEMKPQIRAMLERILD